MWPPSRVVGVTARSRLTRAPGSSAPSEVLASVSCITSAVNASARPSVVGRATVRQQPLTEIESPERGVAGDQRAAHGEPDRVALVLQGLDGAELLDDAGEHVSPSRRGRGRGQRHECREPHRDPHVGVGAGADRGHVGDPQPLRVRDRGDAEVGDGARARHRAAPARRRRRPRRPARPAGTRPRAAGPPSRNTCCRSRSCSSASAAAGSRVSRRTVSARSLSTRRPRVELTQAHHRTQRLVGQRLVVLVADGELGVVDLDGAGADQHHVALRAQPVAVDPRGPRGDPAAGAVGGGAAAVEGGGELPGDEGAAVLHRERPGPVQRTRLALHQPELDLRSRRRAARPRPRPRPGWGRAGRRPRGRRRRRSAPGSTARCGRCGGRAPG